EDDLGVLVGRPRLVGVFNAQQEGRAALPGEEPVEEGGAGAADVEVARGRRGEAYANCHVCNIRLTKRGGSGRRACGAARHRPCEEVLAMAYSRALTALFAAVACTTLPGSVDGQRLVDFRSSREIGRASC